MHVDFPSFVCVERAIFVEDILGYGQLARVVEQSGIVDGGRKRLGRPDIQGEKASVVGDPLGMQYDAGTAFGQRSE
jgi:hypothetical protein